MKIAARLEAHGPAVLRGDGGATIEASTFVTDYLRTNLTMALVEIAGHLVVTDYPSEYVTVAGGGTPIEEMSMWIPRNDTHVLLDMDLLGAGSIDAVSKIHLITVANRVPATPMVVATAGPFAIHVGRPGTKPSMTVPDELHHIQESARAFNLTTTWDGVQVSPEGLGEVRLADARANVFGVHLVFQTSKGPLEVQTGTYVDAGSSQAGPPGTATHVIYHNVIATITGRFNLRVGGQAWALGATAIHATHVMDAEIQNAKGTLRTDGVAHDTDARLFQVQGAFNATGTLGQQSKWSVDGDATFLGVDAATSFGTRGVQSHIATVAAAAGFGIVVVLWFLYNRADPYKGKARQRIIHAVAARPGMSPRDIQVHLECGRSVLAFHLAILVRAEVLTVRPSGRRRTYALNHGSYDVTQMTLVAQGRLDGWESGEQSVGAHAAAAALQSTHLGPIVQAVLGGAATRATIVAVMAASGKKAPSPSLFSKWTKGLVEAGILATKRDGKEVCYAINVSYAQVARESSRVLRSVGDKRSGVALQSGVRLDAKQLQDAVLKGHVRSKVDKVIAELVATGQVGFDGHAYTVA